MSTIIKLTNIKEIRDNLNKFRREVGDACREEAEELAESVKGAARLLSPYDTGRLHNSIDVSRGVRQTLLIKARARNPKTGYNYAVPQHERLDFHHKIGEAKFIERPLKIYAELFFEKVLDRLRRSE
jgi:hypothetical protein